MGRKQDFQHLFNGSTDLTIQKLLYTRYLTQIKINSGFNPRVSTHIGMSCLGFHIATSRQFFF